jgi:hypothetical protein
MSKPIHTPGPLHIEPCVDDDGASIVICGKGNVGVVAKIEYPIGGYEGKVSITRAEDEANARLLAAAYNAFDSAAKKLGVNAVELSERMQLGAIADLISALEQAREHIDGEIDVVDGDYGVPSPNRAMTLAQEIDHALAKVRGGTA